MSLSKQNSHFNFVRKFHRTFGHPCNNCQNDYKNIHELIPFRISLIKEELKECERVLENLVFGPNISNEILVEKEDALCDTLYVIYGTGHCLGIDLNAVLTESNLSIINSEELDIKNIHNIISGQPELLYDNLEDINDLLELFISASNQNNFNNMKKYLALLIYTVYNYGYIFTFHSSPLKFI